MLSSDILKEVKVLLKNINLRILTGEKIAIVGENGSGKTTLIKLINGLLHPTTGEIVIDGYRPSVDTKKSFHIFQILLTSEKI